MIYDFGRLDPDLDPHLGMRIRIQESKNVKETGKREEISCF
jgi:hypothetical protein